jgi:hypothetical protein
MSRALAVFAVALLALLAAPAAALQDRNPGPALDLPAMALMPADLDAEGLDGYAIGVGNLTPWEIEAGFLTQEFGIGGGAMADAFEDAGIDRVFKQFLDLYADPEDPEGELLGTVVSYAYVGADATDAGELFDLMADGAMAIADRTLGAPAVGDAASLTRHRGEDPYTGLEAAWVALHIHAGEDVVGVKVIDYTGGQPDEDVAVDLGEVLVARVAAVREGQGPGLALLALELQWDADVGFPKAYYLQMNGEAIPVAVSTSSLGKYLETGLDNQRRAAFFDRIGTVDVYFSSVGLRGGLVGGNQDYYYEVVLLRFEDEDAAEAYVAGLPDRYAGDQDIEGLTELDSLPDTGDEAVGFAYRKEYGGRTGTWHHAATYIRVGELVARVDVLGVTALGALAERVAAAQARCLADGGCPDPMDAPAELRSDAS